MGRGIGRGGHGRPVAGGGHSNLFQSYQNLIKSFFGAGILALPRAFLEGGMVASTFMLIVLAFVASYCIRQLASCSDRIVGGVSSQASAHSPEAIAFDESNGERAPNGYSSSSVDTSNGDSPPKTADVQLPSYTDIGFYAYGRIGRWACNFAMISSQMGFCIAYMAFISQNLDILEEDLTREHWLLILFLALAVACQLRDIRYISFTSVIGNVVYLISIGIIFYDGFTSHCCAPTSDINMWRWGGLSFVFGTLSFSLEGIALVLPVKADMARPHMFNTLLIMVMSTVTIAYLVFASIGYSFFGSSVHSVITKNLNAGFVTTALRISLSVSLFFTYIIQLFPISDLFDNTFWPTPGAVSSTIVVEDGLLGNEKRRLSDTPLTDALAETRSQYLKRVALQTMMRIALVGFTAFVAFIFKDFGLIISLVGALSNSLMAFILPSLFYMKILRPRDPVQARWFLIKPVLVVVIGSAASVVGLITAINDIINGADEH